MAATSSLVQNLGNAVKRVAESKGSSWWYTRHMAAASRAIAERIPLVDLVVEVRDARIPLSSEYEQLRNLPSSSRRRILVLNKTDLADRSRTKEWMMSFERHNFIHCGVNSHNKEDINELLKFLQARVREIKRSHSSNTITIMLVGIPNVGKSALANSLHQIGRISAAEKGKLRHAAVSPHPGETKDISYLKIGSHPNIYVLDTPGVLPPQILKAEVCSKLALTGAINDTLIGEKKIAKYFLAVLNSSGEYKKWAKLCSNDQEMKCSKKLSPTDHTQDFIVNKVRRVLYETISTFDGRPHENENDMLHLVELQFKALHKVFDFHFESDEDSSCKLAVKLLNLYRTGRLGHYTLDRLSSET